MTSVYVKDRSLGETVTRSSQLPLLVDFKTKADGFIKLFPPADTENMNVDLMQRVGGRMILTRVLLVSDDTSINAQTE